MLTFKEFLNEKIISKFDKDELQTAKEIMDVIKDNSLFKDQVLYRGFNGMRQNFAEIANDRSGFYGGLNTNVTTFVKNHLKVKNPTFATTDTTQASMFGAVHIFLPHSNDIIFHSDKIRDILVDMPNEEQTSEELKAIEKEYNRSNISKLGKNKGEFIVDSKKYYLINYLGLTSSFNSKFFKSKSTIEKMTYGDVYEALKSYVGLAEWQIKNGKRKSFQQQNLDDDKQRNRMAKLRQDRSSPEQLKIRLEVMKKFMHDFEYEEEGFSLVFKTQKAAKEAWKYVKPKMESRQNQSIMMDLSKTEYIDGDLVKNKIIIK